MNIPPKPNVPEEVYLGGILLETITDYSYVPPGHKFLKAGWRAIKIPNLDHPFYRKLISDCVQEQEGILRRKEIDWKQLNRKYYGCCTTADPKNHPEMGGFFYFFIPTSL